MNSHRNNFIPVHFSIYNTTHHALNETSQQNWNTILFYKKKKKSKKGFLSHGTRKGHFGQGSGHAFYRTTEFVGKWFISLNSVTCSERCWVPHHCFCFLTIPTACAHEEAKGLISHLPIQHMHQERMKVVLSNFSFVKKDYSVQRQNSFIVSQNNMLLIIT